MVSPTTPPPSLVGKMGKAWKVEFDQSEHPACIACWILYAPAAHPCWHHYLMNAVHLRSTPGVPPAGITVPGASHEITLHALHPDWDRRIDNPPYPMLSPANLVYQFGPMEDESVNDLVGVYMDAFVRGLLCPDTDHRQCQLAWLRRKIAELKQLRP